ncbi:MAG: transaldolase [Candidatus Thermoplasmatota archaeon]|nr:transaldolase [Candidatus Thermoplasmatota archaeon]
MDIFVDTANLEEIKEAESWGILDGVTTNPSLIKRAVDSADDDISLEAHIKEILNTVDGPVSLEVTEVKHEEMVEEAETLYDRFDPVNQNVVVKIPINTAMEETEDDFEGVKAIKTLSEKGIPVNCTLVMKPNQALMAAKAGAEYVSPFLGRIDDYVRKQIGLERGEDYPKGTYYPENLVDRIRDLELQRNISEKDPEEIVYKDQDTMETFGWGNDEGVLSGIDLLWSIKNILDNYPYDTEIIAASIRTARQVRQCAEIGAEIATIPFDVIEDMMAHHKTREGMKSFDDDVIPEYKELLEGQ